MKSKCTFTQGRNEQCQDAALVCSRYCRVVPGCAHILWVVVLSSSPQASVRGMFLNHRAVSSPVLHMCRKPTRVSKRRLE